MNYYQISEWVKQKTKAYHIIYHLSKYLGFDPITFTRLKDEIFETVLEKNNIITIGLDSPKEFSDFMKHLATNV